MIRRHHLTCPAALLGLALAAQAAEGQRSAATEVDVIAREYAFTMPDTVPAGLVTFRLRDEGREWHHVKLVRLDEGRTLAQVYAVLRAGGSLPSWMHFIGGPNAPAPGQAVSVSVVLEPGHYAVWCNASAPDGEPHWAKGMFAELVVVPPAHPARLPAGDLTLTLRDYGFDLSRPIPSGARRIRIRNAAAQAHEVFSLRLAANAGMEEVKAWLTKRVALAPGEPFGGTTDIPPGGAVLLGERWVPGRYALICWVADARDGRPHWRHGMVRVIDVR